LAILSIPYDLLDTYRSLLVYAFGAIDRTGVYAAPKPPPTFYQAFGQPRTDYTGNQRAFYWVEDVSDNSSTSSAATATSTTSTTSTDTTADAKDTSLVSRRGKTAKLARKYAGKKPNAREASYYLIRNMELFGELGGFDAIINRLENTDRILPPHCIISMLDALCMVAPYLNSDHLEPFVPSFREALYNHLLAMENNDLKRFTMKHFSSILARLEKIIVVAFDDSTGREAVERFGLRFDLKLMHCTFLDKRIHGMNDIKEMIELVRRKEDWFNQNKGASGYLNSFVRSDKPPSCTRLWLSSDYIADWVIESKVLDIVFRPLNTHIEIVRRSPTFLRLLHQKGKLSEQHLEGLWSLACHDQHESMEHLIYDIIVDIGDILPLDMFRFLFSLMRSKPFGKYDFQMIDVLKRFSLRGYKKYEGKQPDDWFGLTLLWEIISNSHSRSGAGDPSDAKKNDTLSSAELGQAAQKAFLDLLGSDVATSQRPTFMKKCIQNIESGHGVGRALVLLMQILKTYPQSSKSWWTSSSSTSMWKIIEQLETEYGLLDKLLKELSQYKARVVEQKDSDSAKTREQLQTRQQFLVFVLQNSSLTLTEAQMKSLWENLVVRSSSVEERDSCFQWLTQACGALEESSRFAAVTEELKSFLYFDRILKLDMAKLNRVGMRMLQHYFAHINEAIGAARVNKRSIRNAAAASLADFPLRTFAVVDVSKLTGTDALWKIIMHNADGMVAQRAIETLNAAYRNITDRSDSQAAAAAREKHIRMCLDQITNATSTADRSAETELVIKRCVYMLKMYLDGFRQKKRSSGYKLTINIATQLRVPSFEHEFGIDATIGDLREVVLAALSKTNLGVTTNSFTMVWNKKTLVSNHIRFSDVSQFRANTVVDIRRTASFLTRRLSPLDDVAQSIPRSYPFPALEDAVAHTSSAKEVFDVSSLSRIAEDNKAFDQLFGLLKVDPALGDEVWEILMMLPLNRGEQQQCLDCVEKNTGGIPAQAWSSLFSCESPYHLLYSLLVAESVLSGSLVKEDRAIKWTQALTSQGGFQFLLDAVLFDYLAAFDQDKHISPKLYRACLSKLSLLIATVLVGDSSLDASLQIGAGSSFIVNSLAKGSVSELNDFEKTAHRIVFDALIPGCLAAQSDVKSDTDSSSQPAADSLSATDELMASSASIVVGLCKSYPSLLDELAKLAGDSQSKFALWLRAVSLEPHTQHARFNAVRALYSLCGTPSSSFALCVLGCLEDRIEPHREQRSEQFFYLVAQLTHDYLHRASASSSSDGKEADPAFGKSITALTSIAVAELLEHESIESYEAVDQIDFYVIGLLRVLRVVVSHSAVPSAVNDTIKEASESSDSFAIALIRIIYHQCLFDIPNEDSAGCKCKSFSSRKEAYGVVTELISMYTECMPELMNLVLTDPLWEKKKRIPVWNYHPSYIEKSNKYVGLRNQGATCYMNSFLQQLYMVPRFREGLFRVHNHLGPDDNPDESLIHQFQVMMGHLKISQKRYYDTLPFCKTFKDETGQPVPLNEQKDVNEFAALLFDRIEEGLKGSSNENLLDDTFRGHVVQQIISHECEHSSEREEPFYMVSVTVKNKANLRQALDLYVEGDKLDGDNKYLCSGCNAKVDALKRTCLHKLPQHLIIHLKRFEFDFDTMRKVKVNQHFEFPHELDVEPYTREGIARREREQNTLKRQSSFVDLDAQAGGASAIDADEQSDEKSAAEELAEEDQDQDQDKQQQEAHSNTEETEAVAVAEEEEEEQEEDEVRNPQDYKYHLVGIVVHTGQADAGHYYSFVKTGHDPKDPSWVEFNDINVRPFDASMIPDECFGGREMAERWDHSQQRHVPTEVDRARNAYMLVYERADAYEEDRKVWAEEQKLLANRDLRFLFNQNRQDYASLPPSILRNILDENRDFFHDRNIFDFNFFTFLWNVAHQCVDFADSKAIVAVDAVDAATAFDPLLKATQLTTQFTFEVLVRAAENGTFPQWLDLLHSLLERHAASRNWLFDKLANDRDFLFNILFDCSQAVAREAFVDMIIDAMRQHRADDAVRARYLETEDIPIVESASEQEPEPEPDAKVPKKRAVEPMIRFADTLLGLISSARRHYKAYHQYFRLMLEFAELGHDERAYMVARQSITRLVNFFTDERVMMNFNFRRTGQGNQRTRIHPPNARNMVALWRLLATSVATRTSEESKVDLIPFPKAERDRLLIGVDESIKNDKAVAPLPWLMRDSAHMNETGKILAHWCREDMELSRRVFELLSYYLTSELNGNMHFRAFFYFWRTLMEIDDSCHGERIQAGHDMLFDLVRPCVARQRLGDERFMVFACRSLLTVALRDDSLYKMLQSSSEWTSWVTQFRKARAELAHR
jgi:ubiquitin C-terminal hydrolase